MRFGKAHVDDPEVEAERWTAGLLLDVDAVGLARGKDPGRGFRDLRPVTAEQWLADCGFHVAYGYR